MCLAPRPTVLGVTVAIISYIYTHPTQAVSRHRSYCVVGDITGVASRNDISMVVSRVNRCAMSSLVAGSACFSVAVKQESGYDCLHSVPYHHLPLGLWRFY